MWSTSDANTNADVASAVQLFNIYDILEPVKINGDDKNDSTALLIDVSDNANDSEVLSSDVPLDLCGSFIDKKKVEYDLLDLYQNIYITPQQVKINNSQDNNSSQDSQIDFTEFFEKLESGQKIGLDWIMDDKIVNNIHDFTHSNKTLKSDYTNVIPSLNKNVTTSRSFDEIIDNAISLKCSKPKVGAEIGLEHEKPGQMCEDDIDEFLQSRPLTQVPNKTIQKSDENGISDSINDIPSSVMLDFNSRISPNIENENKKINNIRPLNTIFFDLPNPLGVLLVNNDEKELPKTINKELASHDNKRTQPFVGNSSYCDATALNSQKSKSALNESGVINTIMLNASLEKSKDKRLYAIEEEKMTGLLNNNNITPQVSLQLLTGNLQDIDNRTVIFDNSYLLNRYKNEIKSNIIDLNSPPTRSPCQNASVPTLQTVKKDNKIYAKRRIVKKDTEKNGFTKGPDIYEKSVVLPQIMSRLAGRKKALNEQKIFERKLKLDTSSRSNPTQLYKIHLEHAVPSNIKMKDGTQVALNPHVLIEDCNAERLKALKLRTAFETFVKSGKCPR